MRLDKVRRKYINPETISKRHKQDTTKETFLDIPVIVFDALRGGAFETVELFRDLVMSFLLESKSKLLFSLV